MKYRIETRRTLFTVTLDGEYDPDSVEQENEILDQIIRSINDYGIEYDFVKEGKE